ncbi:single-stranded DNA-binding protein [Streptomyces tubercidicus]|uniref:single-stranded DNA-binding protein n=1 Tax=Streptomyces tubercidicus TaxID=47759 RepID=UPI0036A4DEA7
MNDTMVTLVGNAATAVEHRQTAAGVTVARFRLAARSRRWDRALERWTDGETSFYTVRSWRGLADNVAASVAVGEPLIVQGRLRLREGEQPPEKGGQRWFSAEVDAMAIGHDLTRGTAAFRRVLRAPRTAADGPPATAQQPSPTPQSPPAPDAASPSQPNRSQSPPSPSPSPSPSPPPPPQRSQSPSPVPPAQQDLWESQLTEESGRRTTGGAPAAAISPKGGKSRTAVDRRSVPRPRTGAGAGAVPQERTAAKAASATAKTPTTSGIAAGAGASEGSAAPASSVTHSPGKVAVP